MPSHLWDAELNMFRLSLSSNEPMFANFNPNLCLFKRSKCMFPSPHWPYEAKILTTILCLVFESLCAATSVASTHSVGLANYDCRRSLS